MLKSLCFHFVPAKKFWTVYRGVHAVFAVWEGISFFIFWKFLGLYHLGLIVPSDMVSGNEVLIAMRLWIPFSYWNSMLFFALLKISYMLLVRYSFPYIFYFSTSSCPYSFYFWNFQRQTEFWKSKNEPDNHGLFPFCKTLVLLSWTINIKQRQLIFFAI